MSVYLPLFIYVRALACFFAASFVLRSLALPLSAPLG